MFCAAAAPARRPPAHSLPAASALVTTPRWPARSDRRGGGLPTLANRQVRPATCRLSHLQPATCRLPASFATTPQLQGAQRVWTTVAKNALRDTMPTATLFEKTGQDHRMSTRKQTKLPTSNRLTTSVAKNAMGDTMQCVASRIAPNYCNRNNFRSLSPKTPLATQFATRQ
jgi:hypothetical protein